MPLPRSGLHLEHVQSQVGGRWLRGLESAALLGRQFLLNFGDQAPDDIRAVGDGFQPDGLQFPHRLIQVRLESGFLVSSPARPSHRRLSPREKQQRNCGRSLGVGFR